MLDFPLMLQVKLPVVDSIHPQSNRFATGVENKAAGDSKLNDSTGCKLFCTSLLSKHVIYIKNFVKSAVYINGFSAGLKVYFWLWEPLWDQV